MWRRSRITITLPPSGGPQSLALRWRSSRRRRPGHHGHARSSSLLTRDAAGMVVPESFLRARQISPGRFDRTVAAAAESILGTDAADIHEQASAAPLPPPHNLGAQLDPRLVRFRGQRYEAQLMTESSAGAAASAPPPPPPRSSTPRDTASSHPTMRSVRTESSAAPATGAHAYLRSAAKSTAETPVKAAAGTGAHSPRPTVELEDGETVAAPRASLSMLQRVLGKDRVDGGRAVDHVLGLASAAAARASSEVSGSASASTSPAAARAERRAREIATREARRLRSTERDGVQFATQQHPCPLQGGGCHAAGASGSASACRFTQYPSVSCLAQLQHGHCELHQLHCCPWHHGDAAHHRRAAVLADSLFALDPSDPAVQEVVQRRVPQQAPLVAALLQLFVDLIAVRLEEEDGVGALLSGSGDAALSATATVEAVLRDAGCGLGAELCVHPSPHASVPARLSVSRSLAMTALEAANGHTEQQVNEAEDVSASFEAMWRAEEQEAGAETELAAAAAAGGDAARALLQDTACLWSSFFSLREEHTAEAAVQLSPWLTPWAAREAQEQNRREKDGDVRAGQSSPEEAAAGTLLKRAATALIECRVRHCDARETNAVMDGARLDRWAPLLLLKDCLLLQACPSEALELAQLSAAPADGTSAPHSLLTDVLLLQSGGGVSDAQRRAPLGSPQQRLVQGWHQIHHVLLRIACGLAQEANAPALPPLSSSPQRHRGDHHHHSDQNGSLVLLSVAQSNLVALATRCSAALANRFEAPMRAERGWAPWDETLMFDAARGGLYGPSEYVRHHTPVVAAACVNSLVNGFLLCSTQATLCQFGLETASPLGDALGLSAGHVAPAPDVVPWRGRGAQRWVSWTHARRQRRHRHRMSAALQSAVQVSLGFVTALTQHSELILAQQAGLKQAYQQRLYAYKREQDAAAQSADHRIRKYHHTQLSDVTAQVDEAMQHEPVLDRLLPHASAAVSPAAVAPLLRLLLESKHSAFKALRLSVSVMRVCRLLRHAAMLPGAVRVQTTKLVHRRVWSKKLNKKVLVATRVPVVRWETPEAQDARQAAALAAADGASRSPGQGVAKREAAVQPVGLLFRVDGAVVAEMCRSGLRMGEAGLALADGVRNDCFAGGIADYGMDRCLPGLTLDTLHQALCTPLASSSSSSCATSELVPLKDVPWVYARDGVERCLRLTGLSQGATQHGASHADGADGVPVVVGQRVAPTALVMEILESHTPAEDTARHTVYDVQWCRDPLLFTRTATVFARHMRIARQQPLWAVQAYEVVWTLFVHQYVGGTAALTAAASSSSASASAAAAWRAVRHEAAPRLAEVQARLEEARAVAAKASAGSSTSQRTAANATGLSQVKALLSGSSTPPPAQQQDDEVAQEGKPGQDRGEAGPGRGSRNRLNRQRRDNTTASSLSTPGARYELRLYEDVQHASHPVEVLWAVTAATVATVTRASLSQQAAQHALLHSVLVSTLATRHDAAQQLLQQTCQCLVLSPVLQGEEGHGNGGGGDWLWSGQSLVVRSLPLFLAIQCTLWHATVTTLGAGDANDNDAAALVQSVCAVPAVAALMTDAEAHPAWSLFRPLASHPDLAKAWLQATLLAPSPALASWIIAQCDDTDPAVRTALTGWFAAVSHSQKEGGALTPSVLSDLMAELGPVRAAPTRGQQTTTALATPEASAASTSQRA